MCRSGSLFREGVGALGRCTPIARPVLVPDRAGQFVRHAVAFGSKPGKNGVFVLTFGAKGSINMLLTCECLAIAKWI